MTVKRKPLYPHIEYIEELSELETCFLVALYELCRKYGRDFKIELERACYILQHEKTIRAVTKD